MLKDYSKPSKSTSLFDCFNEFPVLLQNFVTVLRISVRFDFAFALSALLLIKVYKALRNK